MNMARKSEDKKSGIFIDMLETFLTNYIHMILGLSENTEASYALTFRLLIIYMKEKYEVTAEGITFSMLNYTTIAGFLSWLETERKNSIVTRNVRLAAIKSFAKYAENHNFEAAAGFAKEVRKIQPKRGRSASRAYFTLPELKILISLPNLNTIAGRRDAVLLVLMFVTAARGREICDLKVRDVLFTDNSRMKLTLLGKGNKTRRIIVCEEVTLLLKKFMRYQGILEIPDAYVFRTQNHPQMSVSCIEEIYKKYIYVAKKEHPELFQMNNYTPHSMRHTTAISMLTAGVSLSAIQMFLGHSSITTTQIYAEYTQPVLDETIIKWNESFWSHMNNEAQIHEQVIPEKSHNDIPEFLKTKKRHT